MTAEQPSRPASWWTTGTEKTDWTHNNNKESPYQSAPNLEDGQHQYRGQQHGDSGKEEQPAQEHLEPVPWEEDPDNATNWSMFQRIYHTLIPAGFAFVWHVRPSCSSAV